MFTAEDAEERRGGSKKGDSRLLLSLFSASALLCVPCGESRSFWLSADRSEAALCSSDCLSAAMLPALFAAIAGLGAWKARGIATDEEDGHR